MLGIFIVLLKPAFFDSEKCTHWYKLGRNGREIMRGSWYSLQCVTVPVSWSGKLLGFTFVQFASAITLK